MKKSPSFLIRLFGLFVLIVSLFISCNIGVGLGEGVDTQPPKLEASYPPSGCSAIKGSFIFAGSCSDDRGIKEVKVKVSGSNVSFSNTYTATVNSDQTAWSIELNKYDEANAEYYNGWEFPDGKYDIYVTAYDNAGQNSGEGYYRNFEIDNTAPLFVISKPGVTKESQGNSKYGSIFTVEGTIADDHEIAKMELYVYDTDGKLLTTEPFTEENVATSGGTNVTIARFIKNGDNTDYNSLYENAALKDSAGTAYFTSTVKLTDNAKEYKDSAETENNTTGNSTTVVYLYDDVYTDLMSSKTGAGLSADNLKSILNGTLTEIESTTWTSETVAAKLASCKIDTAVTDNDYSKTLAFSLNPDAEPTYSVGGYSLDTSDLTNNKNAFGGQSINLIASAGRDKTKVVPSSIKVWLREITASDVANLSSEIETLVTAVNAGEEVDSKWTKIFDNSESKESSDETVSIELELPDDIVAKKYYLLVATGKDADNENFSQNSLYGFIGNANIPAPTVLISSPRNNDYCQAGFSISGTISGTDITGMKGYFVDSDGNEVEVKNASGEAIKLNPQMNIQAETFTDSLAGLTNGSYKIKYQIADNYGQFGYTTVAFIVDSVAPDMTITEVGSTPYSDGLSSVISYYIIPSNSNSIKGKVSDAVSGVDGVYYYVGDIPEGKETPSTDNGWKASTKTSSGWTIALDFTDLEASFKNGENTIFDYKDGSKGYMIHISALDYAGNASATQSWINLYPDNTAPVSTVTKSTEVKEFDGKQYAQGSFTISGTITEKAVKSLTYSVDGSDAEALEITDNEWTKIFAPETDGEHTYKFTVTDKAGNSTTYTETVIKDSTAPEIKIENPLEGASVSKNAISISATDSGSGILDEAVTYSILRGGIPVDTSEYPLSKSKGVWVTDEIDFTTSGEGTYTLKVNASDKLGNASTEKEINFYYDISNPSITVSSLDTSSGSTIVNKNYGTVKITGSAKDSNNLEKVEIREGSTVLASYKTVERDGDGNANIAFDYSFASITDGTHNYTVGATDTATKSTEQVYKVVVDTQAPEISKILDDTSVYLDDSPYLSISATVKDNNKDGYASGLAGVYYLIAQTAPATPDYEALTKTGSVWTEMPYSISGYKASNVDISKYNSEDSTYYIFYAAMDNNGNITYDAEQKTTLTLDKSKPAVEIKSYRYTGSAENTTIGSAIRLPKASNGEMTVTVQVKDSNPESLTVTKDGVEIDTTAVAGETGVYTFAVTTNSTDGNDTTVELVGKDTNGRISDTKSLIFSCDTTAPTATVNSIGNANSFLESNSVTVSGTAYDTNLKSVSVSLYKGDAATGTLKETKTVETDSSNNWSAKFYDLEDVQYQFKVVATDTYENSTEKTSKQFKVDTKDPESTLTATQDSSDAKFYNSSFVAADKTALANNATYYTNKAFTLGGTITEANLSSAILKITKNGTEISGSPETLTVSENKWSYNQTADSEHADDGTYVYTLTVADEAGRSTTYKLTVVVDTTAPAIAITSPSGDVTASSLALGGTLVENGSGVKSVVYSIVKLGATAADNTAIDTNKAADVNGAKWSANTSLGDTEGKFTLTATITDNLGFTTNAEAKTFWFDSANPTLELNDFTSSYMNTVPSISGTATDANGITSIVITDDKTSTTWSATAGSDGTFSTELTGITEAAHTFTVKVTDGAGKITEASKSVTYDKTAPTVNSSEITSTAAYQVKENESVKENWFKSTNIAISVTATDSNSGLSSADYVVKDSANNEIATGSIFGSNGTYSASVVCSSQGANTITLTIKDQAGNTKDSTLSFYIDSEVPVRLEASKAYRGETEIEGWTNTTPILTNAGTSLKFDVSGADFATGSSGLATVVLKKIGSKTFTSDDSDSATTAKPVSIATGTAAITLTKEQIASGSTGDVIVTVRDNVGNTADFTVANLTIDTTKPSIGFSSISPVVSKSSTSYLNGTITVAGRINESNNLKTAGYKVYSNDTEVTALAHTFTSAELKGVDNIFDFTIDTTADGITDEKSLKVEITAEDEAGNSATYDSTTYNGDSAYIVSQDTDRPEIKISNISAADAILSSGSVIGTISDDDGIKEFYYSEDEGTSWTEISVSSGSWSITLDGGSKSLYFKVIDTAGKIFITKDTSSLTRPKLGLGTDDASDMNEALKFKVDLTAPVISNVYIMTSDSTTVPAASAEGWSESTANFGKSSKYMFVKVLLAEDIAMHDSAINDLTITAGSTKLTLSADNLKRTGTIADGITYIAGPFNTSTNDSNSSTQDLSLEGNQTLSVVATDKSGRDSSAKTMMFYVDGAAPVVSLTYPLTSQEITTDVEVRGTATDASSISTLKYMIPTVTQRTAYTNTTPTYPTTGWTESSTKNSFSIPYNSTSYVTSDGTSLIWYATQVSGSSCTYALTRSGSGTTESPYTYSQAASSALSGAVYIPILFYAEDSTGNGGYTEQYVCVNPAKSLPTAEILAPSDSKIGTSLTLSGSASDTKEVKSVKVTGIWYVNSDKDLTDSTNAASVTWTQLTNAQLKTANLVTIGTVDDDAATITAEGTTSWKVRMDLSKLTDITFNWIKAEVYAFDENADDDGQQARQTSATKIVAIDKDVPTMSDGYPKLVKTSSSSILGTDGKWGTFSVERAYDAGMYIANTAGNTEGGWYLIGEVTDDISVNGVTVAANSGDINLAAPANTWQSTDKKTYRFAIAVPSDSDGKIQTKLSLDDGQNQIPTTVVFNVDNTAPKMYNTSGTATAALTASELRLKSGGLQINATSNVVENSDGSYTFGDELVEAGSGLAYVVYWFEKDEISGDDTTRKVASPMFASSGKEVTISDDPATGVSKTSGTVYLTDNLPALYLSEVTVTNGVFTVTANDNICAGGLVKINGAYYLISDVSGTTVTLKTTSISGKYDVEVIYAQVVNHQITEGFDSSNGGVSNDDGDGMVEMVKQTGTTYKWSSSIYSDNISDGPAKINIVAFDEAGNSNYGYVSTSIQNNRPRLAKVYLGTDLNGNDKFDYEETETVVNDGTDKSTANGTEFGELSFYSALSSEGKVQGTVTLKSSSFVAKNKLLVLSEVVGGNVSDTNPLKYAYKIVDSEADATATTADEDDLNSFAATTVISGDTTNLLTSSLDLDGYNYVKGSSEYNTTKHSTNSATGSLKAVVLDNDTLKTYESWTSAGGKTNKYIAFTFWDATTGTTQGTNSLYALLKVPVVINVVDDVKPEAYIKPFFWNSKEDKDSSFVYSADGTAEGHIDIDDGKGTANPGVSGKVWINGHAEDETMLKELWFKEPGTSGKNLQIAKYENASWSKVTTDWPDNWLDVEFLNTPDPTQSGHSVDFRLKINMTTYGLGTDQTVDITAKDAATTANSSASSTAQTIDPAKKEGGVLTPHYIMDFVPYIKSIYPASAGSANRSRLGKFPVQAGQSMVIEGLNFAKDAAYTVHFYNSSDTGAEGSEVTSEAITGTVTTDGQITVTAPEYSRYVEVTVSNVLTKNNTNTNGGYNIESGYVSGDDDNGLATANTNGTDFWTDDRYISVWKTGDAFANASNPISGSIVGLTSTSNVYTTAREAKTFATNTIYGIWGSNDNMMYNEVFGTGTNQNTRWYILSPQASGAFRSPPSETDSCIVNNNVFHTWLDDGWADKETFGNGLQLVRDGETAATSSSYIEKTSDDKVRHQFQNIKIAGAYKNSKYYMYVTYYDSYTKCLKYGMMEFNDSWDQNRSIEEAYRADSEGSYVIDGWDATTNESITAWDVGEYSAIKIDNSDTEPIPVVSYYDKKNGVLKIARGASAAPVSKRFRTDTVDTDSSTVTVGTCSTPENVWTYTTVTSPSNCSDFGRYVSMEMDSAGNLHIAAQDVTNGKLYYGMFVKQADNTYAISGSWQAVDATSSVGRWNDIKLTNASGTTTAACKPVITYQNASKLNTTSAVKIAYIDDSGNWEAITDDSAYEAQDSKLSLVIGGLDKSGNSSKYAIGINSTDFAVDFLRGE